MHIHACFLDRDCRDLTRMAARHFGRTGIVWRVSIYAAGRYLAVALHPNSRFAGGRAGGWIDYARQPKKD